MKAKDEAINLSPLRQRTLERFGKIATKQKNKKSISITKQTKQKFHFQAKHTKKKERKKLIFHADTA